MNKLTLPPMPLDQWEESRLYWQLMTQILGKIRMKLHPKLNHWWHVPLYVTPRGTTTGAIPFGDTSFDMELDLTAHKLVLRTGESQTREFPLGSYAIAEFYNRLFEALRSVNIEVEILAVPYKCKSTEPFDTDHIHTTYDPEAVHRGWTILKQVEPVLKEFRSRFIGKCSPVHEFWHSFDLAVTRFSGKRTPDADEITDPVAKEAYSHEVISAGFWFGDDLLPHPAFYSYTWPAPKALDRQPLKPDQAFWREVNGQPQATLLYEDLRKADDPRSTLLDFLQSSYEAGANLAGWDRSNLEE